MTFKIRNNHTSIMIKRSDVTIVIPHLGATKEQCYSLTQCLASLKEYSPDIQILVVKNGNIPCTCRRDIRMIQQGQCKAVNAAVAITYNPWIMVSNDDMVYSPDWFEYLTRHLEQETNLLCVSPKLVEPRKGAPTFLEYFCGGAGGDFDKEKFLRYVEEWHQGDNDIVSNGFNLPFLIRRDLWDTIGGYDIKYDPWGSNSDSDLEYKIKLAGIQPVQAEECLVYHFSQTSGTFEPRNQDAWQKNWDYFIEKWGFPRTDEGIWEASFSISTVDEGRIYQPAWEGKYA